MPTLEGARDLAESIASVANGAGLPTVALITNMSEPLASAAGNALEVLNAVDYLTGAKRDARLHAVTLALGAELLTLAGLARDRVGARAALERSLANGAAAERFERMVAALGGAANFLAKARELLPIAPLVVPAAPERAGFVLSIDAREIGLAVVELGGGRARASDTIDPAVGLTRLAGVGAEVSADAPLALVHARDAASAATASRRLGDAYHIGAAPQAKIADPVTARIGAAA
jgi:thymidine phosphorylase